MLNVIFFIVYFLRDFIFLRTSMRVTQIYGDGEIRELLSLKYAIVVVQRENRIKQKKIHRSLQAQLE